MPVDARIPLGIKTPEIQTPLDIVAGMQRVRAQEQAQQINQMNIEEAQRAQEGRRRTGQIAAKVGAANPTGKAFDRTAFLESLPPDERLQADELLTPIFENQTKWKKVKQEAAELEQKHWSGLAEKLQRVRQPDGSYSPTTLDVALSFVEEEYPAQAAQLRELAATNPAAFNEQVDMLAGPVAQKPGFKLGPGDVQFDAAGKQIASVPAAERPKNLQRETVLVKGRPVLAAFDPSTGQYQDRQGNPLLDVEPVPTRAGADGKPVLSPGMEANIINRLTTQWDAATKPVRELQRQAGMMDAGMTAARRGDLAAGAQTVLVTFQKILDVLSVVRSEEYKRSAEGQSVQNRIRGSIERLSKGGAGLPMAELEKFATLAHELAAAQHTPYIAGTKSRLGKTADRYGIPHELIFEGESPATVGAQGAPNTGTNVPKEGTEGTIQGTAAVWKTVNGVAGWYAK